MDLRSLEIKISRSENLPVLPEHVSQILKLVDKPHIPSSVMESIVQRDAAVTAKVLRVANSPFYGLTPSTSISRAIHSLGPNQVRSLVIGVAYQQAIGSRSGSRLLDRHALWQHSMATAVAARIIAKLRLPARVEEMYDAGMLHDLGILVLDKYCPDELDQCILYAKDQKVPLVQAELVLLGCDHYDIAALLADKWAISETMQGAIFHHALDKPIDHFDEACIIAAADAIARQCGYDFLMEDEDPTIPKIAATFIDLGDDQVKAIRDLVTSEVELAIEAA